MKKGFGRTCMNKLYPSVPQASLEGYELGSTAPMWVGLVWSSFGLYFGSTKIHENDEKCLTS